MRRNRESGLGMLEYALALALLVGAFLLAQNSIRSAGEQRAAESAATVSSMLPCDQLSGDACK